MPLTQEQKDILGALQIARPEAKPQRLRAAARGLTLGASPYALAAVQAPFTQGGYKEALAKERGLLEAYYEQAPWEATGYEMAGAALPAVAGLLTGGAGTAGTAAATSARIAPSLARAAGVGALEGGIYGYLGQKGGLLDMEGYNPLTSDRLAGAAGGAAFGAGGGVAGGLAGRAIGAGARKVAGAIRRKPGGSAGSAVNAELQKLMADTGLSTDEIVSRVGKGEIIADMSDNLRLELRKEFLRGGPGAEEIAAKLPERAQRMREEASAAMKQSAFGDVPEENLLRIYQSGEDRLRQAASNDYNQIFAQAGDATDEITSIVESVLQRDPDIAKTLQRSAALQGKKPFYGVSENGEIILNKFPTVEEVEKMRRVLKDKASKEFKSGDAQIGRDYLELENTLRTALDETYEDLRQVRQKWSDIESQADTFRLGRTAMNKSADEVDLEFSTILQADNADELVKAYRQGVVASIRKAMGQRAGRAYLSKLTDPTKKEAVIFETIFPQDQFPDLLDTIARGGDAYKTVTKAMSGSETAGIQARLAAEGTDVIGKDIIEAINPATFAQGSVNLLKKLGKQFMADIDEKQRLQIVRLMISEDPDAVRRALTDADAQQALIERMKALSRSLTRGGARAGAVGAARLPTEYMLNVTGEKPSQEMMNEIRRLEQARRQGLY